MDRPGLPETAGPLRLCAWRIPADPTLPETKSELQKRAEVAILWDTEADESGIPDSRSVLSASFQRLSISSEKKQRTPERMLFREKFNSSNNCNRFVDAKT